MVQSLGLSTQIPPWTCSFLAVLCSDLLPTASAVFMAAAKHSSTAGAYSHLSPKEPKVSPAEGVILQDAQQHWRQAVPAWSTAPLDFSHSCECSAPVPRERGTHRSLKSGSSR